MMYQLKYQSLILGAACVLSGCGADKKNGIDFYDPTPTEVGLQLLGDSYLDFESSRVTPSYEAYIPSFLNQLASQYHGVNVVYRDRSVSGSKLDYILGGQYESARAEGVKTLVINGGANDLREPCATSNIEIVNDSYVAVSGSECENALASVETKISTFFSRVADEDVTTYGAPPDIIWLGRYNLPSTVTHKDIVNRVNEMIISVCNQVSEDQKENYSSFCTYVDTRNEWTVDETDLYLLSSELDPYASDGAIHVNELGGQIIANVLWEVISNPANEFFF